MTVGDFKGIKKNNLKNKTFYEQYSLENMHYIFKKYILRKLILVDSAKKFYHMNNSDFQNFYM